MKTLAALSVCVLFATAPSPCSSQTPQSAAQPPTTPLSSTPDAGAYAQLVDRLKAGDRTVDFTELRMAFTQTPAYRGMMMGFYQPLWRTLSSGDFEGALRVADNVLRQNYTEPNAHMVAARVYRELGHSEQVEFHQFVVDDLDDLLAGMDGLDDFLAGRLGLDAVDEIAGDLEIDVGFEERHTDFAEGIGDVGLGDFAEAAQVFEGVLELAAQ